MSERSHLETRMLADLRSYSMGEDAAQPGDDAVVEAVLARATEREAAAAVWYGRTTVALGLSAAAMAAAAAAVLIVAMPRGDVVTASPTTNPTTSYVLGRAMPRANPATPTDAVSESRVAVADAGTSIDHVAIVARGHTACFEISGSGSYCVAPGQSVTIEREPTAGGPVVLLVLIGQVEVATEVGPPQLVRAGESFSLAELQRVAEPTPRARGKTTVRRDKPVDPPPPPLVPSADELLDRALAHRTAGELQSAIRTYAELVHRYPSSSAAGTALVSLAQLKLRHDPGKALAAFDRYLEGHKGVLVEEALYGRARALRALGRKDAERAAVERYLASHPGGAYAKQLRGRLVELKP